MATLPDRSPRNINNTGSEAAATATTTASVIVVANENRITLWVSNLGNIAIAVRCRTAAADNNFTGIVLQRGESKKVIGQLDVYTGEVSIVADSDTVAYTYTEY